MAAAGDLNFASQHSAFRGLCFGEPRTHRCSGQIPAFPRRDFRRPFVAIAWDKSDALEHLKLSGTVLKSA